MSSLVFVHRNEHHYSCCMCEEDEDVPQFVCTRAGWVFEPRCRRSRSILCGCGCFVVVNVLNNGAVHRINHRLLALARTSAETCCEFMNARSSPVNKNRNCRFRVASVVIHAAIVYLVCSFVF